MKPKKIHFIAIGGSAMHNLAIALHKKGYIITGSDDEIFEPSKSRLAAHNILPEKRGWNPDRINPSINICILGMHAKKDNPELLKAQSLNLPVVSYPEFLYKETKNKKRIAIAGSHGKTTTTAMVMHVLKTLNINFDYMVGASIEGFDTMVNLKNDNEIAIFEADEYLSSPIDLRSKFLWYKPHISVITGIAWDHINVFPTFESYLNTFDQFIESIENEGIVFWYKEDTHLQKLISKNKALRNVAYKEFESATNGNETAIRLGNNKVTLNIFGAHNLQNLNAAYLVIKELGISDYDFTEAIKSFKGAARRLQTLRQNPYIYYDFAHAPSKVKATVEAVKSQHSDKKLVACLELHTFSSLNKEFIPQYRDTMNAADEAIVYFNPSTLQHKQMPELNPDFVTKSFNHSNSTIYTESDEVKQYIKNAADENTVILIMTSGNFDGIDFKNWEHTK